MIEFVVAIARSDEAAFEALACLFARSGLRPLHLSRALLIYCQSRPQSRFAAHIKPGCCTLGVEPRAGPGDPGAYVRIDWSGERGIVIDRDPTGLVPCWRLQTHAAELFCSDPMHVIDLLHVQPDIDWDYIVYHLNAPHSRGRRTGIVGVTELLPGWQCEVIGDTTEERARWIPAESASAPFATIEEAQHELRHAAEESVGSWGRRYERIALTVSGGLDSAIVLGLLRTCAPGTTVIGVNYLVSHAEGDERQYAEAVASLNGVPLRIETISPHDLHFELDEAGGRLRPGNFVLPLGYRQARERIAAEVAPEAIFSGTGGDHLFHEHASPQIVADAFDDRRPLREIIAIAHQHAPLARETLWTMLWSGYRAHRSGELAQWVVTPNAFLAPNATVARWDDFLHPDIAFARSPRLGKQHQIVSFHQLQDHLWRYGPAFPTDEIHPLLSFPLLDTSLRIPTYWFGRGAIHRGLARKTFGDLLPDLVRDRRGKGSNTSHWIQVMTQNLPFLRDLMLNGELVRRGYVDRQRMDAALTPLSLAGKMDFGGFTACITTEIWIQQMILARARSVRSHSQTASISHVTFPADTSRTTE
ncbi:asparagine synthase-related protein [Hephaestia sp. GCM10023244]|uniref:asparagine synthase-related protein n=1 Tax=unclassified Hephaestia TaxID=2631281 RepID=UPI002077607E|nr:asparagine synthase C-terminal domain-containing protein [Hephaestia sp. MAHUQ-44]MCM8732398.1 asparagine synthase C-terminal domain-containing protein [Hephaestia sp. MAHUQ-44]